MDVKQQKLSDVSELRGCVNVEVAVEGSPSLTVPTVSVDVKQHRTLYHNAQELCKRRGGRSGFPLSNSPYGFCERKVTSDTIPQSSVGGRPGLSAPNSPY